MGGRTIELIPYFGNAEKQMGIEYRKSARCWKIALCIRGPRNSEKLRPEPSTVGHLGKCIRSLGENFNKENRIYFCLFISKKKVFAIPVSQVKSFGAESNIIQL